MDGGLKCQPGGIFWLINLIESHRDELEFDLIKLGLRLDWVGTEALSWRDLLIIVKYSGRDSMLSRSINGDVAAWTHDSYLMALIFDALQVANWQRGGGKGTRPRPIKRPKQKSFGDKIRGSVMSQEKMNEKLGW